MLTDGFVYLLALYRDEGTPLGQVAVDVDWEPALQWVRLLAMREGRRLEDQSAPLVRPLWHESGRPYLAAVRVALATSSADRPVSCDFTTLYFREAARAAAAAFVESGRLISGERLRYLVLALTGPTRPSTETAPRFTVRRREPAGAPAERALLPIPGCTKSIGSPHADDPPAFIGQHVLDEIAGLAERETEVETGGALIGHLYRDPSAGEVFAQITAQLPAQHTSATATRLTFSSDTWVAMREEAVRRGAGERLLGWWHTHVGGSQESDDADEAQLVGRVSPLNFFSHHDCALHRAVFPNATSLALVASPRPGDGIEFGVFGWRCGLLQSRGLHVLKA
jgi:hypothetical protein